MTCSSRPAAGPRGAPPLLAAAALACGLALAIAVLAHVHPALLPLEGRRIAYRHALLLDLAALAAVLGLVLIVHAVRRRGPATARAWKRAVAAGIAVVAAAFALRLIETWAVVPPRTADACAEQGGMWAAGADGVFRCNPRATDAGHACLDSGECQGLCLALPRAPGAEPLGQCAGHVKVEGCPDLLRHGQEVGGCGERRAAMGGGARLLHWPRTSLPRGASMSGHCAGPGQAHPGTAPRGMPWTAAKPRSVPGMASTAGPSSGMQGCPAACPSVESAIAYPLRCATGKASAAHGVLRPGGRLEGERR